jgi:hypothetical protein
MCPVTISAAEEGPCDAAVKTFCSEVKPGGGRILACLKQHEKELSTSCKKYQVAIQKMTNSFREAFREACSGDVREFCSSVKSEDELIAACLEEHKSELSESCKRYREAAQKTVEALQNTVETLIAKCGEDTKKLCSNVGPGDGRLLRCLRQHEQEVSMACKQLIMNRRSNIQRIDLRKAKKGVGDISLIDQCASTAGDIDEDVFGIDIRNTRSETLRALDDLGIKWVRIEFYWPRIEAKKGVYVWDNYDKLVRELQKRNIQAYTIINYWPKWIKDWGTLNERIRQLSKRAVERYKPGGVLARTMGWNDYGIRYWEIINEPNYPCCGWLKDSNPQPKRYAHILSYANAGIREIDPDAVIALGGLSSHSSYMDPLTFLERVYENGAKNCFDIVSYHPYGQQNDFQAAVDALHTVMGRHKDEKKPIWFTEFGDSNKDLHGRLFEKVEKQIDVVPAFFWFSLNDISNKHQPGVLDQNFNRRALIYRKLKEFNR